jgi:ATP-dependent DNA helicase PIF1
MMVEKAILNLVEKDFAPKLAYMGVSRVKTLNGLMFEESFDLSRFRSLESYIEKMRAEDVKRRGP